MLIDNVTGNEYRYEVYLCKPYTSIVSYTVAHEIISCLTNCVTINTYKQEWRNVNELDFDIYMYWNDVDKTANDNFDLIKSGYYILLEKYIDDTLKSREYMYIYECQLSGGEKEFKSVKCYSKEYLWNKIKIRQFNDTDTFSSTRKIYDGSTFSYDDNTVGGIIDYIIQEKLDNSWTVSYMSASLEDKYRTRDISESSSLDVVRMVEDMFNCIFIFDTYQHLISIKDYDDLDTQTGLIVTGENYIKSIRENIKIDEIVTRLYATGEDDIGLNGVSITGLAYIDDFSYFMTTDYMDQDLIDQINAFISDKESNEAEYQALIYSLGVKQGELSTLQSSLSTKQTELIVLEDNEDTALKFGTCNGHDYSYWHNLVKSKNNDIAIVENQITAKELEITGVQDDLLVISLSLNYDNYFSVAQKMQLIQYINEDTVTCKTDDETELLDFAETILAIKATPPIEFEMDIVDIYKYASENYTWDKLTLGALIDVQFDALNIQTSPRVTSITHSPESSSLSITVSNKNYFNDDLTYVSNIIAQSKKIVTIVDNERSAYKEYSVDKDTVLFAGGGAIDAGDNPITTDNDIDLDRRGLWMRKIRESTTPCELRILEDKILISKDEWETYETAITGDGISCNSLWVLTNTNGSVEIDENTITITDMNLEMTANNDNNEIIINPTDGIQIKQCTTPVFYAESDGSLYLKDIYLSNTDGSISLTPNLLTIENGSIIIKDINGSNTMIDSYGIDPRYLNYFKNMVWNSQFETYAADNSANYWTGGVTSADANFEGNRSMKLTPSTSTIQSDDATINPAWFDDAVARVSFYRKFGECKCEVYDVTNSSYFTLTDNSGETPVTGTSLTYANTTNWTDSRASFSFDPTSHPTCTEFKLKFTNTHLTEDLYIDCVMLHPDFTSKWPQIYKDGPNSDRRIFVQATEPTNAAEGDLWVQI
jgi:hypothetical protein